MIENSIVYRTYKKADYFPLGKAQGSEIFDRNGKRYIDFTSGWNVNNLGFNHPEIAQTITTQLQKNAQSLLWGSNPIQEEYAQALTDALPQPLNACCKETGGTESIETAIKIARVFTKRSTILGFSDSYHGQLFASLALGGTTNKESLVPLVPAIETLPFPSKKFTDEKFVDFLANLESRLAKEDVAALVTEAGIITGWGSTTIAHPQLLTQLRRLTKKYDTLLIVDEVGTGFSRTGKLFAIEHEQVVPDMICLAKGISNGVGAIGTVVGKAEIFEPAFDQAWLISTFGWTPLACAAALKTLQIHQRDDTAAQATQKGQYIKDKLALHLNDKLIEVDGLGLELGLRLDSPDSATILQQSCFADGLQIVVGSGHNIQLMPPLNISMALLDEGLDILIRNLTKLGRVP